MNELLGWTRLDWSICLSEFPATGVEDAIDSQALWMAAHSDDKPPSAYRGTSEAWRSFRGVEMATALFKDAEELGKNQDVRKANDLRVPANYDTVVIHSDWKPLLAGQISEGEDGVIRYMGYKVIFSDAINKLFGLKINSEEGYFGDGKMGLHIA